MQLCEDSTQLSTYSCKNSSFYIFDKFDGWDLHFHLKVFEFTKTVCTFTTMFFCTFTDHSSSLWPPLPPLLISSYHSLTSQVEGKSIVQYIQYSIVQYSIVQYSIVQYSTVQYSIVQYIQYTIVYYSIVSYSIVKLRKATKVQSQV